MSNNFLIFLIDAPSKYLDCLGTQKDVCKGKQRSREIENSVIVGAKAVVDFLRAVNMM